MVRMTRVNPLTRILCERLLPHAGEITVSKGQKVSPVQVVARTSQPQGYKIVPAAEILDVPPEELPKYLLVEEGAAIQRKKPLLRRSRLLGSKQYVSPINGVLYQVGNGRLILQHTPRLLELRAMVEGLVHSVRPGRGVVIETAGALLQVAWASPQEGYGKIRVVSEAEAPLRARYIDADARGAVIVAGFIDDLEPLEKAEENSVRGVIAGSMPSALLSALDRFRFPIMITEGFMGQPMAEPFFQLLQQAEGREASLFGQSSGAEGNRPEIIIPLPVDRPLESLPLQMPVLAAGDRVRILRAPYTGQVGKVVTVYNRPRRSGIGIQAPGADVALDGEEAVFIPMANLDLLR